MGTETYGKPSAHPCMKYGNQKTAKYAPDGAAPDYQQVGSPGTFNPGMAPSGKTFARPGTGGTEYQTVTKPGGKMKSGKEMPSKGTWNPESKSVEVNSADYNPQSTSSNKSKAL